jgi:K319L-like, PKD domain
MSKRRSSALAVLALAAAAVFVLPASSASAASALTPNACANSVTANFSQVDVTNFGDDGLTSVPAGGATTTTGLHQDAAIPGAIFVAGYNLGLLVVGPNNVPANVTTKIQGTNTTQNIQTSNTVGGTPPNGTVTVSTVITDPDGTPGTGDETATDASFSVDYNDMSWTAGASGTIDYRQAPIPDPGGTHAPTAASNSLLINALVGGIFAVQFRCAPGTVLGENPGVITLEPSPAAFDTTTIGPGDTAPTADAGPDQTVAPGALVTLDGTGSTDPEDEALTYAWTQLSGPAVTLTGADTANPTFTAPASGTLEFQLEVCDEANPDSLCSTDTVMVTVQPPAEEVDAAGDVIVKGKVHKKTDHKVYFLLVANLGDSPITVDPTTDIDASVLVNGTENGSVEPLTGPKTIAPGHTRRFPLRWNGDGRLAKGDTVEFTACVNVAGDIDATNDCDDETRTAR